MTSDYFLFIKILIFKFFFSEQSIFTWLKNQKRIRRYWNRCPWYWIYYSMAVTKSSCSSAQGLPTSKSSSIGDFPPTAGVALMCNSHCLRGCQWGGVAFAHSSNLFQSFISYDFLGSRAENLLGWNSTSASGGTKWSQLQSIKSPSGPYSFLPTTQFSPSIGKLCPFQVLILWISKQIQMSSPFF